MAPSPFLPPLVLPCDPAEVDAFLSRPSPEVAAVLARHPGPMLVLGAGGKLGLHVCLMLRRGLDLLGRADRVVAVSRFHTLRGRAAFESRGIATIACDLSDRSALAALPEAPTVFFLAGVKFGTAAAPGVLQKLNRDMPHLVASRFHRARIVAFSSGCVYPFVTPASGGATETTPVQPNGAYAASCLARETAFASAAREHGTAVALIRLNYSVEFRYGLLLDIALKVASGRPVDVTTGHVNVIWQRDAVDWSIRCLDLATSPAAAINLTGPEILSVRALAERFGELLRQPVRIAGKESDTAWLNNASLLHARFGRLSTSVEEMVTWTAAWLRAGGAIWDKPTGFDRRDGAF